MSNRNNYLIYLASPYSSPNKQIMEQREQEINDIGAELLNHGYFIYGPISMSVAIARSGKMDSGWDTWKDLDLLMIDRCDVVWVADMPGWQESVGVTAEIEYARQTNKRVMILNTEYLIKHGQVKLRTYKMKEEYENGS